MHSSTYNESVVEAGKDVHNSEHILTLLGGGAQLDDLSNLLGLVLGLQPSNTCSMRVRVMVLRVGAAREAAFALQPSASLLLLASHGPYVRRAGSPATRESCL